MAKKSMIVKNIRRRQIVERYREKRIELKKILKSPSVSEDEKQVARIKLEKMPRDSNPIRIRNRCVVTGRPRSYYRKFGLSRITFREMALKGEIPGVTKAQDHLYMFAYMILPSLLGISLSSKLFTKVSDKVISNGVIWFSIISGLVVISRNIY